ncbi:hypothetical protein ACQKJZ_03585 [Sphingomonas sp. NPDC019816]|uniref:hypothetical protein n=1 Tax=Sphingomonas sp. NPDC019816 TaxID=3390679 RepID=UPI003D08395C
MAVEADPDQADRQAARWIARVAQARRRAARQRQAAALDLSLDDTERLTDRIRLTVAAHLRQLVEAIFHDLKHQATRLAVDAGHDAANFWSASAGDIVERLRDAGMLHDAPWVAEIVAQAHQRLIAAALPSEHGGDAPSLLVRLSEAPDRIVAVAARAVLAAADHGGERPSTLTAQTHHALVWAVAAAMRDRDHPAADRALAQAAERVLAARDESEPFGAAALRLAMAIDARPAELPDLLLESLSDRQLGLFVAFLSHALGFGDRDMREIVLEPEGDRLWLALRALDLDRVTIARIGWSLSEADRRRDIEAFADGLDDVMSIAARDAAEALAILKLPAPFRAAIDRFDGTARR